MLYRSIDALPLWAVLAFCQILAPPLTWADSKNNYINPERSLPTPYGLKIAHSGDEQAAQRFIEYPGLSMGIYAQMEEEELPVAGLSLRDYLETIELAETAGGAYSADLAEPLVGMAYAYQAEDKHRQALDLFRRALHLSRINEGLYSPNQLPALEGMINSLLALGLLSEADERQEYRFRVQQHVYAAGDPGLLQATLEFSEWQREAYLGELGDETYLRLLDMHDVHSREIDRLEADGKNGGQLIEHLRERLRAEYLISQYEGEKEAEFQINVNGTLEKQLAVSAQLEMHRFSMIKKNNFRNGRKTLLQIIETLERQEPVDILELARAKIALGDWYLWWDWRARALQSYEQAYALLDSDGNADTDPEAFFTGIVELPEEPVFVPGTMARPPQRQARAVVMFDISRVGRIRDIEVVEIEAPDADDARIALFELLREIRFRPRVTQGETVAVESIVREYRFEY